jgi:hypothetical protein
VSCVHEFHYKAVCINCGSDALEMLRARTDRLEEANRAAVGYLVGGRRDDAEKALREALRVPWPTELPGEGSK